MNNKQIAQFFTSNKYIALTDSYIWHDRDYFEYERPEFMTDEQRPRIINFYNDNQAGYQIAQAKVTDSRYSAIGYHEIKRKYSGGNNNHSSPKRIPFDGSGHLKFYTNKKYTFETKAAILAFYLTDNMFFV